MKTSQDTKKKNSLKLKLFARQDNGIAFAVAFHLSWHRPWASLPGKVSQKHIENTFCFVGHMLSLLSVVLQMQARSLTESHLSETNDSFSRNGMMMGCQGIMKVTILVMYIRVKLP